MINLIISLILGIGVGIVCAMFVFESVGAAVAVGIVVFLASQIILNRIMSKKVQTIMMEAQAIMQDLGQIKSQDTLKRMMPKIIDRAVAKFSEAYHYGMFQFGVTKILNGQIGSLYYMGQRFEEAEPYLSKAFLQQTEAQAMYACCLYRKQKFDEMKVAFDKALRLAQRKPLIFNMYAWCLTQQKDINGAIRVLNQCKAFNPKDEVTLKNLDMLKNSNTMKMTSYGAEWYQYFLEAPDAKAIQQLQQMRMGSPFATHQRHR